MNKQIFLLLFFTLHFPVFGQNTDTWFAFRDKKANLIGFKDKNGREKIKPTFNDFTSAYRFDKIIGVCEDKRGKLHDYYLTKTGRKVCEGDLYIFDYTADCESEGFIRFRDKNTHRVGLLNGDGDIAVPAVYNELAPVRNGMIVALKGARFDKHLVSEINQYPWIGGQVVLIDTNNQLLAEGFRNDDDIDLFSVQISDRPNKSKTRDNFKAVNGKYLSFINYNKEFRGWLKSSLLDNFTKVNLTNASYKTIFEWKKRIGGWVRKRVFINRNFTLIRSTLIGLSSKNRDYEIITEGLDKYIYNFPEFENYYDNCGQAKTWIYPVKTVVITHKRGKNLWQDQFDFLRTDKGYKLIEVSIPQGPNQ